MQAETFTRKAFLFDQMMTSVENMLSQYTARPKGLKGDRAYRDSEGLHRCGRCNAPRVAIGLGRIPIDDWCHQCGLLFTKAKALLR